MDYTQSDSFDTDAGNGHRYHEDSKAVPTIWSAKDANSVIWSLMEVLKAGGVDGKQFNRADPGTYTLVRDAIVNIIELETEGQGGLPRFTPYVWGGRAVAMPEGDQQSSGQQLTDLMYPTMRAEVTATQFTCTEAEWQADPYKRVTHWSLGDGGNWMRPPDKNGVQPGNVGAFYGVGANPAGGKPGTAVIDAMRRLDGYIYGRPADSAIVGPISGAGGIFKHTMKGGSPGASTMTIGSGSGASDLVTIDLQSFLPAGTTTDPVTGEFRPRTWYGIWVIRMYGRVTSAGNLNAPALNARMDMIDARVATLEGRKKALGDGQSWQDMTASRMKGTTYTNTTGRPILVLLNHSDNNASGVNYFNIGGLQFLIDFAASYSVVETFLIPVGSTYSFTGSTDITKWAELR